MARPHCKRCGSTLLLPWYDGDKICLCGEIWYARPPLHPRDVKGELRRREPRLPGLRTERRRR